MRFYASILLVSMLGLNLSSFVEAFEQRAPETKSCCESEMSCETDRSGETGSCCCGTNGSCGADMDHKAHQAYEGHQACEDHQDNKGTCHCGCDCSHGIQIVAINHHLQAHIKQTPVEHLFVTPDFHYESEYLNPRFQPPRIA